jgi:hypothetical protein
MLGAIIAILGETIQFMPQAIKLGMDVTEIVSRGVALSQSPAAATTDELAAFGALLAAERAKLVDLTNQLNKD